MRKYDFNKNKKSKSYMFVFIFELLGILLKSTTHTFTNLKNKCSCIHI